MKGLKHFKFLLQCSIENKKLHFDGYNLFYNILIFILFAVCIINKNNMLQMTAYFYPDISPFFNTIAISSAYIFVCIFLISKIISSFSAKKMIFYKELGFAKTDVFLLKIGGISGTSFICSLMSACFMTVDFNVPKFKSFCIYTAIFFISLTLTSVILSYIYNPLKPHSSSKSANGLWITKIFFRNKYTSYFYKDMCRVIRNSDFIIGYALIIFIMAYSSAHGKNMHIVLFSIILYFSSVIMSAVVIDFYIAEAKDYLLMKLSGVGKRDILRYKTVNICIISGSLLSLYYTVNLIIGNISFASTFLIFLSVIIHSFVSITANNLVSVHSFPDEMRMKYNSLKLLITSLLPFVSLIMLIILLKNKQISEL